jgi:hypothetical protein
LIQTRSSRYLTFLWLSHHSNALRLYFVQLLWDAYCKHANWNQPSKPLLPLTESPNKRARYPRTGKQSSYHAIDLLKNNLFDVPGTLPWSAFHRQKSSSWTQNHPLFSTAQPTQFYADPTLSWNSSAHTCSQALPKLDSVHAGNEPRPSTSLSPSLSPSPSPAPTLSTIPSPCPIDRQHH